VYLCFLALLSLLYLYLHIYTTNYRSTPYEFVNCAAYPNPPLALNKRLCARPHSLTCCDAASMNFVAWDWDACKNTVAKYILRWTKGKAESGNFETKRTIM
jgi:hypothetical protein